MGVRYLPVAGRSDCRIGDDGSFWRHKGGRWVHIKGSKNDRGYITVKLPSGKRNVGKTVKTCVLVLDAFVGTAPPGHECCHEDDDKGNNNLSNLSWKTHKDNMKDRSRNGGYATVAKGSGHGMAVLTEDDAREIRRAWLAKEMNGPQLARKFRITPGQAWAIGTGKSWKHLS